MTGPVDFEPHAERDIAEAADWYDEQRLGLGDVFLDAVEAAIDRIADTPLAFPREDGETRRAILRRFPYQVYYQLRADHLLIIAIMHTSRHPDHWRSRS